MLIVMLLKLVYRYWLMYDTLPSSISGGNPPMNTFLENNESVDSRCCCCSNGHWFVTSDNGRFINSLMSLWTNRAPSLCMALTEIDSTQVKTHRTTFTRRLLLIDPCSRLVHWERMTSSYSTIGSSRVDDHYQPHYRLLLLSTTTRCQWRSEPKEREMEQKQRRRRSLFDPSAASTTATDTTALFSFAFMTIIDWHMMLMTTGCRLMKTKQREMVPSWSSLCCIRWLNSSSMMISTKIPE